MLNKQYRRFILHGTYSERKSKEVKVDVLHVDKRTRIRLIKKNAMQYNTIKKNRNNLEIFYFTLNIFLPLYWFIEKSNEYQILEWSWENLKWPPALLPTSTSSFNILSSELQFWHSETFHNSMQLTIEKIHLYARINIC